MYNIVIKEDKEKQEILILENGFLTERIITRKPNQNVEGNIYIGKIQNVLPGMQAAFVNIGEDKNAFIHLKDILPKVNEASENESYKDVDIRNVAKPGMPIVVQAKRAENDKKGARISTHISLSGKYMVLMPNANFITISRKIEDEKECERIKEIVKELLPENMGAIIRTLAQNQGKEALKKDAEKLLSNWYEIEEKSKEINHAPCIIYEGSSPIQRILNDLEERDINSIITNNEETYAELKNEIGNIKVTLSKEIENDFEIQKQIDEIEKRKIWLKCGGFITIDKTEALTAIDVNSGKYVGDKNLEQTVYAVNKEATIEIAKQLKLRDIGGIIIIDYIDMKEQKNIDNIENLLKGELKKDRSKTQVLGFTKLNLLEMTRKHIN